MHLRHLLPLLLCAACAGTPPSPEALPASPLARAALVEWQAWGRITVTGWPAARPADIAATPWRFARLVEYWGAVPGGGAVVPRLLGMRSALAATVTGLNGVAASDGDGAGAMPAAASAPEDIGVYAYPPWSAAFISAVARLAGLPESDLPSSSRHTGYIDTALERALSDPAGAYFRPYAPEERAPAPGDLLCADRSAAPLTHWSMRLGEAGRPRAMHCDVVVRAGSGGVDAVGGNVENLVALRRLPADPEGRVLPAPPGEAGFVLILAARATER